ncbi:hypothetical protein AI2703V1_1659, partial [Escherichia coli]
VYKVLSRKLRGVAGNKILINTIWMISEKSINLFGLLFVTSYVASYVGPGIYGQIVFATAFFQIFQIVAQLGSDVIIFKRLTKNVKSGLKLIKATASLRSLIYFVSTFPILIYFFIKDNSGVFFLLSSCIACFFASIDIYNIYYNALLKSKINTIINIAGLSVSLIIRWFIADFKLDPLYLCIPIITTTFVPLLLRIIVFKIKSNFAYKLNNRNKLRYIKYHLKTGLNIVVSTISVAIYTRLSMFLLQFYMSSSAVAVFSVGASLAGSWYFICNSFIISSLPSIFNDNNYKSSMRKTSLLHLYTVLLAIPILIIMVFFGKFVIYKLYGLVYSESYPIMLILSLSTLLSLLGTISARYIVKYSGYSYLSKKMFIVMIVSLFFNLILIRFYGIHGAAYATLITELLSFTLLNYFYKNGIVFKMHLKILTAYRKNSV